MRKVGAMTTTVRVRDEKSPGRAASEWALELLDERLTARELIRRRVYQEVTEYNARAPGTFRGLVQPSEAKRVVDGYRIAPGRRIDWEQQADKAVELFARNGFVLLVDDRQVADLDEEIELHAGSVVTFLKLVPLVGG